MTDSVLADDAYTEEVFFVEEDRKVNKLTCFRSTARSLSARWICDKRSFRYALTGSAEPVTRLLQGQRMGQPPHGIFTAMHTEPVQRPHDQIHFWHLPKNRLTGMHLALLPQQKEVLDIVQVQAQHGVFPWWSATPAWQVRAATTHRATG